MALEALFGKTKKVIVEKEDKTEKELIEEAQEYYSLIEDSMREGDWTGIGDNLGKLGEGLGELS